MNMVLADINLADARATVIAQETIQSAGQVPVPFTLQLAPAAIDPYHRYAVLTPGSPYFSGAAPQ